MNALSPSSSPKVKRKISVRRPRAGSYLPPLTPETHDVALHAIRTYLKGHTSYDSFPVSFRMIVLDSKLEVRKALQCLLLNGEWTRCTSERDRQLNPCQAWSLHLSGTAKSRASVGCSRSQTLSISFSTTTSRRITIAPPPM